MEKIIVTIIGITALIFWVSSIQTNNKGKILIYQTIANIFYAIQYFFLGAFSAAGMNLVSIMRGLVYYENEKKKKANSIIELVIFISAILTFGIVTYGGYLTIIPIIATLLYTCSTWQKNTKIIRVAFLMAAFCWIYYNISVGAYIPLIGNFIELTSGIIAIIKYDLKEKNSYPHLRNIWGRSKKGKIIGTFVDESKINKDKKKTYLK